MPFSKEEFDGWHQTKRRREHESPPKRQRKPITECVICSRAFAVGEGMITDDVSICDLCDGDD